MESTGYELHISPPSSFDAIADYAVAVGGESVTRHAGWRLGLLIRPNGMQLMLVH